MRAPEIRGRSRLAAERLFAGGLVLAALIWGLAGAPAWGAPAKNQAGQAALAKALGQRDDLLNSTGERRKRHAWLEVIQSLSQAAEKYPSHKLAPEALASAVEVAFRSGRLFGIRADFEKTYQLGRLFVKRYPQNARAPGCQLAASEALIKLDRPEEAYSQLLKIESNYPAAQKERQEAHKLMASLSPGGPPPGVAKAADIPTSPPKPAPAKDAPAKDAPAKPAAASAGQVPPPPPPLKSGRAQVYHLAAESQKSGLAVLVYLDKSVPYLYNLLPPSREGGPYRIYVDFQGSELIPGTRRQLRLNSALASQAKLSQFNPDTVRLVLEMPQANPYTPQMLKNPDRLVLGVAARKDDLAKINLKPPPADKAKKPPEATAKGAGKTGGGEKKSPGSQAGSATTSRPAREAPDSLARQLGLRVRKVIIDPGHGGRDSGAMSGKRREKDITFKAARLLAEKLRKKGFTAILTRNGDAYLSLERRTRLANEAKGDLFISLHVNAHPNGGISGFETYFLNLTTDRGAVAVAARENASSEKSISDLNDILNSIAKNTKITESRILARTVQNATLGKFKKSKYKVKDLGVKQAPFYVLVGAKMPSILVEMGFITNPEEGERLTQDAYLNLITDGLAQGVLDYQKSLGGK